MTAVATDHRPDVLVIGGGAIGLAAAWRAAVRGLRVLVLERDAIGAGASHVAAGMLAPVTEANFGEERLTNLGVRSVARWPAFASALGEASGVDPGVRSCGTLVVAAGSWSGGLPGLPEHARMPVRPVKGQVLRLRDPEGPGLLERNLRMDTGRRAGYLVPRGDGRYVLGATMEERGFDTSVTAGAVHDLVHDAAELLPGVLELELEEAIAGLRPGTPDNAPAIGRGALEGLVWATGHHRNGILLTPLTANAVEALLTGEEPEGLEAADPGRFAASWIGAAHPAPLAASLPGDSR